jgi:hypothetical protein
MANGRAAAARASSQRRGGRCVRTLHSLLVTRSGRSGAAVRRAPIRVASG